MKPDILKEAFAGGFSAFFTYDTTPGENGRIKGNPSNPYQPNTLPYKEWERGYNAAYFDNKKTAS